MPTSDRRASVDDPGPANTCPPQFSQKRPRRSERIRPPTRLPDSRSTVSQCRSLHPAARPARPPPTMTTSFIGRTSFQQCTNILLIYLLNVDAWQGPVNGRSRGGSGRRIDVRRAPLPCDLLAERGEDPLDAAA